MALKPHQLFFVLLSIGCWRDAAIFVTAIPAAPAASAAFCEYSIKVMNYNTRQLPMFAVINDWDQTNRLNHLPKTLRLPQYQADVVILNELMTQEAFEKIKKLKDVYPFMTTVVGKDCSGLHLDSLKGPCSKYYPRSGVMAMSKLPILQTHGLIYKNTASGTWDARCNKGAIYVKLLVNGMPVHVVGTHTQATEGLVDGSETRVKQMQEMRAWMKEFAIPKDEAVILAGDLNTEFQSDEFKTIFADNFVFKMKKQDFGTFSAGTNWLARADKYVAGQSLYDEDHLDYIATWKDHLQPVEDAVMSTINLKAEESWYWNYLDGWWYLHEGPFKHDGYYNDVSDHYPVVATFAFKAVNGKCANLVKSWINSMSNYWSKVML